MLQRIRSLFSQESPPADMHAIPCSALDFWARELFVTYGIVVDYRLDAAKLEESINTLVETKFQRAGARFAMRNGIYEFQIPRTFSKEVKPLVFTTDNYAETYATPIGGRPAIPVRPVGVSAPSVQPCPALEVYFRSKICPVNIESYLAGRLPILHVHVTTFDDITFLGITVSHCLFDGLGTAAFLSAWTRLINGEDIDNITGMPLECAPFETFADKPSAAPPRGWFELGVFQAMSFGVRMLWKMWRDPKEKMMLICVPKEFVDDQKASVMAELQAQNSAEWVGSSDVLLAWFCKTMHHHRDTADQTPIFIHTAVDLRPLHIWEDGKALSHPYVHNAMSTITSPPIPAGTLANSSIADLALQIRRAIKAYTADLESIRTDASFRCANPTKLLIPCTPDGEAVIHSNWRAAKFGQLNFPGAAVDAGAKATVRSILAYFPSSIPLRGSSVVLSEDDETLWMSYIASSQEWERIKQSGVSRVTEGVDGAELWSVSRVTTAVDEYVGGSREKSIVPNFELKGNYRERLTESDSETNSNSRLSVAIQDPGFNCSRHPVPVMARLPKCIGGAAIPGYIFTEVDSSCPCLLGESSSRILYSLLSTFLAPLYIFPHLWLSFHKSAIQVAAAATPSSTQILKMQCCGLDGGQDEPRDRRTASRMFALNGTAQRQPELNCDRGGCLISMERKRTKLDRCLRSLTPTTMSVSIADFPPDVLLEVAKQLSLADLLSLLSVCRIIRELKLEKSLWIDALTCIREVDNQPLPLPNSQALDTLSLLELENAVRQTHRLVKNLQSETPRPVRLSTFAVESAAKILPIPGANLTAIHPRGGISCWDTLTCQRVAHLEIPGFQVETEACMEIEGKALFAAYASDVALLAVVCVDFRDRAHISISNVISPVIDLPDEQRSGFFISAQVVGFCTKSSVIFWSMDADAPVQTKTQHFDYPDPMLSPCLAFGRSLYVGNGNGTYTYEHTIHALPLLPASDHHPVGDGHSPTDMTTFEIPFPVGCHPNELGPRGLSMISWPPRMLVPYYGIFAVTGHTFRVGREHLEMPLIQFWPGSVNRDKLEFAPGYVYQNVLPVWQFAIGASGTYVLLLQIEGEDSPLGLVHFSATPAPHTTFRKLDIGNVSLSSCDQIAFDDSLGLVFVANSGKINVISYA
ncbi:hypothetical protein B0H19DRAFT_1228083 [Mycena capillaripes]|nr:hypothetical protein B0H19DRAFT_1228083 [Mycena capillaripes]